MATIKLAPSPVFMINRAGEVVGADHKGPHDIIECRVIEINKEENKYLTLQEIVGYISDNHNVENVYILTVESSFNSYVVRYGYHSNF